MLSAHGEVSDGVLGICVIVLGRSRINRSTNRSGSGVSDDSPRPDLRGGHDLDVVSLCVSV